MPSLTVTCPGISAEVSVPITPSTPIASFTDTSGDQPPADYAATIDWGDGTSDASTIGYVYSSGGTLYVSGYHTFLQGGDYTYTVSVTGDGGSGSNTGTGNAFVYAIAPGSSLNQSYPFATSFSFGSISYTLATGIATTSVSENGTAISPCGCNDAGMMLNYNSATVAVAPVIQFTYHGSSLPTWVAGTLTWNGTAQATVTWDTTGDYSNDLLVMDLQSTATVTASGAIPGR